MKNEKRLIDANAIDYENIMCSQSQLHWLNAIIEQQPTVDAVEVVRCKDCKHGVWDEDEQMWKCVYSAEFDDDISEWFGFYEFNEGEHFCSRGERKDND